MSMITDIEDYFTKGCGRCPRFETAECSTRFWAAGLAKLREICLAEGLEETVKWGQPCYMHAGRNLVIFGAFQCDFRLSFFEPGLMKDPEGILEPHGPNTKTPGMVRFTANEGPTELEATLRAYIREAKGYAEVGLRAPKVERELDWPEELTDALDADPELADAFHALTPGRQKSYLFNLNAAKKPETRVARIIKFRDKILAGKGAQEY